MALKMINYRCGKARRTFDLIKAALDEADREYVAAESIRENAPKIHQDKHVVISEVDANLSKEAFAEADRKLKAKLVEIANGIEVNASLN